MTTQPTYREVMGMRVPLPLAARLIEAILTEYPSVTTGKDPDAAVRAVVRYWFVSTLANHEAKKAAAAQQAAASAAQEEVDLKANSAREKALRDAEYIEEITDAPVAPAAPAA